MAPKINKQPNRKLDEDSNRYLYNEYTEVIKKKNLRKKNTQPTDSRESKTPRSSH